MSLGPDGQPADQSPVYMAGSRLGGISFSVFRRKPLTVGLLRPLPVH